MKMTVGLLAIEIIIPQSGSLKDKRMVINHIKDRLQGKFNVSVAEVGYQEKWQRAQVAIAQVSADRNYVEKTLHKIFRLLDDEHQFEIITYEFEYI